MKQGRADGPTHASEKFKAMGGKRSLLALTAAPSPGGRETGALGSCWVSVRAFSYDARASAERPRRRQIPGIEGWDEIQGDPSVWHVRFMQIPDLPEKLVASRQADYLGYFFNFGKFTRSEVAHYVTAYATPAQLHAAFEMYRAFPANAAIQCGATWAK